MGEHDKTVKIADNSKPINDNQQFPANEALRTGKLSWRNSKLHLENSLAAASHLATIGIGRGQFTIGEDGSFVIQGSVENLFNMSKIRQLPAAAQASLDDYKKRHPKIFIGERAK